MTRPSIDFKEAIRSIDLFALSLTKMAFVFQQLLPQDAIVKIDKILIDRYGESFPRSMIEDFIESIPNFKTEYPGNIALTQEQAAIDLVEMGGVRIFGCFIRPNEKGESSLQLAQSLLRENSASLGMAWNDPNLPSPP